MSHPINVSLGRLALNSPLIILDILKNLIQYIVHNNSALFDYFLIA